MDTNNSKYKTNCVTISKNMDQIKRALCVLTKKRGFLIL